MYQFILSFHNILRWGVLLVGLWAMGRAVSGLIGRRSWTSSDHRSRLFYTICLDVQFLVGLILYFFLSPVTMAAFQNFSAAMQNDDVRFFAMEHGVFMLLSLVFAHVGSVMTRKANDAVQRHKRGVIWIGLSLIALLAGIPWWRPLLRLME